MNDLYLIGNGFDLAHGLKTSYNDFLLWYLKRAVSTFSPNKHFADELLSVDKLYTNQIQNHDSLEEFFAECKQLQISIKFKHFFFENIVSSFREYRWVDIEYEYYSALVKFYKEIELNPQQKESVLKAVKRLNNCFALIKKNLVEYLGEHIKMKFEFKNDQMEDILFEGAFNEKGKRSEKEILFVCFNYTPTMELYLNNTIFKNDIIYIHGGLNDYNNPIIFGYGDEIDPHYEKIENLNINEFLRNIKSFNYFKTDNYQKVIRFIEGEGREFTVKILGHSCGLSDRILLNTIFEHKNCKLIKIYHYEKSQTGNDYFEKTQEISRHFKAKGKGDMRMKIMPFNKYNSMPQAKKDN